MGEPRENHFVPGFYLRQFSRDGRSIDLFNFARMNSVRGASIRGQCSRRNLYSFAPGLEQVLSGLENEAAGAIRTLRASARVPAPGSDEWKALIVFVVFQKLRTRAAGDRNDVSTDYFAKLWARADPELGKDDPDTYRIVNEHPVALSLLQVPRIVDTASDLELHLFVNETSLPFVTSDDPVVLHNSYCEGIDYFGVLGWGCSGIQVFWPVSPRELLLIYDSSVYRVGRVDPNNRETCLAETAEVRLLNSLQILNAHHNVYYLQGAEASLVEEECLTLAARRPKARTRFVETEEVEQSDGETSSLIHQYEPLLPVRLRLSAIDIRKRARRVPLHRRGQLYRMEHGQVEDRQRRVVRKAPPGSSSYPVKRVIER